MGREFDCQKGAIVFGLGSSMNTRRDGRCFIATLVPAARASRSAALTLDRGDVRPRRRRGSPHRPSRGNGGRGTGSRSWGRDPPAVLFMKAGPTARTIAREVRRVTGSRTLSGFDAPVDPSMPSTASPSPRWAAGSESARDGPGADRLTAFSARRTSRRRRLSERGGRSPRDGSTRSRALGSRPRQISGSASRQGAAVASARTRAQLFQVRALPERAPPSPHLGNYIPRPARGARKPARSHGGALERGLRLGVMAIVRLASCWPTTRAAAGYLIDGIRRNVGVPDPMGPAGVAGSPGALTLRYAR